LGDGWVSGILEAKMSETIAPPRLVEWQTRRGITCKATSAAEAARILRCSENDLLVCLNGRWVPFRAGWAT